MIQPVPFLDLVAAHREMEEELLQVARDAIRSAGFIGGPQVDTFEQEFAQYCGVKYCVGVGSGTDALRFALMALGVGPGDAVVTVSHTFIATVEAISQSGAGTEFVDIDERTYTMSPSALAEYLEGCRKDATTGRPLGRRTGKPVKAIVPVHLYGQVADMDAIVKIAKAYGLLVVEDACQAHGAEHLSGGTWRRAGSFGVSGAFSFYPGKNLGACGEAGAVVTNDTAVAQRVRMIRDHGQVQKYYHDVEGYNGRLDAIQAGFLRVKLRRLNAWNAARRAAAFRYNELFGAASDRIGKITTPFEPEWSRAVYHLYVIRTNERSAMAEYLKENGIFTGLHYPVPVHRQKCYREWGYQEGDLPVTEHTASQVLSLPMFPGLTVEQQSRVRDAVESFTAAATP